MGGIAQLPQGWQGWLTPILIQFFAHLSPVSESSKTSGLACILPSCHTGVAAPDYILKHNYFYCIFLQSLAIFITTYDLWLIAIMILLTVKEETCNSRNGLILMRMVSCCWVVLEIFLWKVLTFSLYGDITRASDEFIRTFCPSLMSNVIRLFFQKMFWECHHRF